jgi:hypothetical protein
VEPPSAEGVAPSHDFTFEEFPAPMDDKEQHVSTTEARAGTTPHMTRYVLGVGLILIVLLFALLLLVWS